MSAVTAGVAAIPTLSEWGTAILSAIMAVLVAASRRRVIRQR
ncbi:MAG: IPTL-CTERM sorting domain-containing protein [Candidatus Competibacteraceae bacterium]|nr:IPTL-CTERM sorting domain-containing protein [Candidatus Competibacteraceae bacterium]